LDFASRCRSRTFEDLSTARVTILAPRTVIWLHTSADPSAADWAAGIEKTMRLKAQLGVPELRSLVVTDGGAPNAPQRHEISHRVFNGRPSKLAVITNTLTNPIKRGVATAISWANPAFLALPPERWREAFGHADLEGELDAVLAVLQELQKDFPPVKTLVELERAIARTRADAQP